MNISILGCGLVSSLGGNVEEAWQAMLAGKDGMREIDRFPMDEFSQTKAGLLPESVEEALRERDDDLAFLMMCQAAREAIGGYQVGSDTGLVLGTNFGLLETREWCWRERIDTGDMDASTFQNQQDVICRFTSELGLSGPSAQLSLSCASGAAAVALGRQWLVAGRCRQVLIVCYDAVTEHCWCGLSNLRTITTDALRPFNIERSGTVFSEGAGALLLTADDAPDSLAYLLGAATNNNAYHMTAPAKEAEGSRQVMAEALRIAGVPPEEVDFVCAHATGTAANDVTESAAINNLLDNRKVPVAGFKSNLGHMMGAAGMAEIIMTIQAIREGVIPGIINTTAQDPACDVDAVIGAARPGTYQVAITDSAGLGGNNASVVVGSAARAVESTTEQSVVCSAISWVLPGQVGMDDLPSVDPDQLCSQNEELSGFPVKQYIQSVKGYLDPNSAFSLAAASLALGANPLIDAERTAVASATQYGASTSGYRFYELMVNKGHRFASPMVFPHSYSNTAGNLVAIESELAGPHLVFDTATDATEAYWVAHDLIRTGQATEALVIVNEGAPPTTIPDGQALLHGAICIRLTSDESLKKHELPVFLSHQDNRKGTVYAVLCDLLT